MIINICLEIWATGGAEIGYKRLAQAMPEYEWRFVTKAGPCDVLIYSNSDKFYHQAKSLNIPKIILRTTGPRSYAMPQYDDLFAVVCSSRKAYELSKHPRRHMVYNGVDFERLSHLKPIACDILVGCARVGLGQQVEKAILYAKANKKHLTVLGGKQHLHEDTYNILKNKYPEVTWTGVVDNDTALAYVKGCNAGIMPTSVHGVSNFVLELVACDKPVINIGGVEVPPKSEIDINITARKYKEIIEAVI